jgi:hypothetical protein
LEVLELLLGFSALSVRIAKVSLGLLVVLPIFFKATLRFGNPGGQGPMIGLKILGIICGILSDLASFLQFILNVPQSRSVAKTRSRERKSSTMRRMDSELKQLDASWDWGAHR